MCVQFFVELVLSVFCLLQLLLQLSHSVLPFLISLGVGEFGLLELFGDSIAALFGDSEFVLHPQQFKAFLLAAFFFPFVVFLNFCESLVDLLQLHALIFHVLIGKTFLNAVFVVQLAEFLLDLQDALVLYL